MSFTISSMECPRCHFSHGNFKGYCYVCGYPVIDTQIPRNVRFKENLLIANILRIVIFVPILLFFCYKLGDELIVRHFGKTTTAQFTSVDRIDNGFFSRSRYTYIAHCRYSDDSWGERQGWLWSGGNEYEAQPIGKYLAIRYSEGNSEVERDDGIDADDYMTILLGSILITLPIALTLSLWKRWKLLKYGRYHRAIILSVSGDRIKSGMVEYEIASQKISKKVKFEGEAEPIVGSSVWILEDGSKRGITAYSEKYEWECIG